MRTLRVIRPGLLYTAKRVVRVRTRSVSLLVFQPAPSAKPQIRADVLQLVTVRLCLPHMPFVEALKLAVSAIWGHKLRSFLTLLGVIFGVATVIVVVSLIEGFNAYVDEKIANIGTNALAVSKFSIDDFSSVEALNAARRRNKDVTLEDAAALMARRDAIQEVGAKEDSLGDVKFGSTSLFRVHISATTPNVADIEKIEVAEGRYFSQTDEETRRNVTFIGD